MTDYKLTRKESNARKEAIVFLKKKGLTNSELGHIFKIVVGGIIMLSNGGYRNTPRKLIDKSRKRDGYKCVLCNSKKEINTHHIDENRNHNTLSNLVTLCYKCHHRIHSKELKQESEKILKELKNPVSG